MSRCKNCTLETNDPPLCPACWDEWVQLDHIVKQYDKTKRDPEQIVNNKDADERGNITT